MTATLYTLTRITVNTTIKGRKIRHAIKESDVVFDCTRGISPRFFLSLKEAIAYQAANTREDSVRSYSHRLNRHTISQYNTTFEISACKGTEDNMYNIRKACPCGCKDDFLRALKLA